MQRIFSMDNPGLIGVHAEDEAMLIETKAKFKDDPCPSHHLVRPPEAALEAVRQLCELTEQHQKMVHICHLSTQMELDLLKSQQSQYITVEACPHHLFLSAEGCHDLGNFSKCNPPVRSESDRAALWAALVNGEIDTIGSDHAPHTKEEKLVEYWRAPSGLPGVETSLPLMLHAAHQGLISYEQIVSLMCARPAEIFRLPTKGAIEVGMDADLIVVRDGDTMDLAPSDLLSRCDWSPFEGTTMAAKPELVINGGAVVAQKGKIVDTAFRGHCVEPSI
jgi:dihydroorotase